MPGYGTRVGNAFYRAGSEGVVTEIVPEPDKLDGTDFQLTTIKNNLACRIFGRSNAAIPPTITVKWDTITMPLVVFYGEPGIGKPFVGIWALLNQPPRKGKLEISTLNKTDAGCAAIRAGSLGGSAAPVSTDYENALTINYPTDPGNLLLLVAGCIGTAAHPMYAKDRTLTEQYIVAIPPKQGSPGASAYFGSTFIPSPNGSFTIMTAAPATGIIAAAEWSGVPA